MIATRCWYRVTQGRIHRGGVAGRARRRHVLTARDGARYRSADEHHDRHRPGTRPLRADAARNHRRIVEAAAAAFESDGPTSRSTRSHVAGVGVATLYRRFPTSDQPVRAVLEEVSPERSSADRGRRGTATRGRDSWFGSG
ncbi:hypothetical protein HBB16_16490 [Pseudonocardia sp. MCCB 268]|nr:hypothetical protein [Pseudonocardia cytotoxica]